MSSFNHLAIVGTTKGGAEFPKFSQKGGGGVICLTYKRRVGKTGGCSEKVGYH